MKQNGLRAMFLVLVCLLFLSINRSTAFAASYGTSLKTGYCGSDITSSYTNLRWTMYNSGTLVISGNGKMKDYVYNNGSGNNPGPWASYQDSITAIVIEEGVTSVGEYAFAFCRNAASVSLPNTLMTIGLSAFSSVKALTEVTLPDSLYSCSDLAFQASDAIETINIGKATAWTGIGCSGLVRFTVDPSNTKFSCVDGVLYSKDQTQLYLYPPAKAAANYVMPKTVKYISRQAFESSRFLRKAVISPHVKNIPFNCFAYSTLEDVFIPQTVTSVETQAFSLGAYRTLTVHYGGTAEQWAKINISTMNNSQLINGSMHYTTADSEYTEPTCVSDGHSWDQKCTTCGATFDQDTVFPATGVHSKEYFPATDPTCVQDGYASGYVCRMCGYTSGRAVRPATGHVNAVPVERVEATCLQPGNIAYEVCETCGSFLTVMDEELVEISEQETVIGAIAHANAEEIPAKDATCTEAGCIRHFHCGDCGAYLVSEADEFVEVAESDTVIRMTGHSPVTDPAREPTCTEAGATEGSHCEICETVFVAQQTLGALGHSYGFVDGVEATCTKNGYTDSYICERCGDALVDAEEILATGHKPLESMRVEATCTEVGHTEGSICETCSEILSGCETISMLGHTFSIIPPKAADCETDGNQRGVVCGRCGFAQVVPEVIPASGHDEEIEEAVEATCETDGRTEGRRCKVCNKVLLESETIKAFGHTEEIEEAVEVTCEADGRTEGRRCKVCDKVLLVSETIPAPGHTIVANPEIAATCDTAGSTGGSHCAVCGKVFEESTIIPAYQDRKVAALPNTLTEIGEEAFADSSVEFVIVPSSCTTVGARAFAGCMQLKIIYLPGSVTSIADDAFNGCDTDLVIVTAKNTAAMQWAWAHGIHCLIRAE